MSVRLLSVALLLAAVPLTPAAPPPPPADFAVPQTPVKPPPFPITMVDQGKFDPRLKGYFLPDGFKLEIVMADPDVVNPVGLTFAPDGTLYVLEWVFDPHNDRWFEVKETFRYRDGSTRQVATMRKFVTDLVKEVKYDPATGQFRKPKVIIADELPSSVLFHDGHLYLSGRGTVRRYSQSKLGGNWDVRETIAQGFCGFHHHQVSGMSIGNDGLLYITSGDDDNFAEGQDGSRATVMRTGAVFRCRPDGTKLEEYSRGYRNPYRDLCHDDKFNWFHADNDNEDGSRFMGCRIMHVAEGADFGWRLKEGVRCCRPDVTRGAVAGELPGRLPPMIKTGRGSPAGMLCYHDTRLPEHYRGLFFYPDVFRKLVRAYSVEPDGSSFAIPHEFEFFKSDDPLFRPCQMVTGPDGAIYVCDWRTDSGGAGKLFGDGKNGRIYRITWAGTKDAPAIPRRGMDSWAKILKQTDEQLVDTLGADDLTDRVEARKELVRRGAKAHALVLKRFVSGTLPAEARLTAMGVLQAKWGPAVEDLFRLLLNDESPDTRRLAADGLGLNVKPKDERTHDALVKALTLDRDPAVRRAAALAVGRLGNDGAADGLLAAYKAEERPDAFLKDAYVRGLEKLGKTGVNALLALAQSGENRDKDLAVDLFLTLRTKPAADALPEILNHPHLSAAQREMLVRSYANYSLDPPISLDPLADFLARRPNEPLNVVQGALEVFALASELSPKAAGYVKGLLASPSAEVRLGAIKAVEDARLAGATPLLILSAADATRDVPERAAVLKAMRALNDKAAIAPVQALLAKNEPAALKVEALRTLAALNPEAGRTAATKLLDQTDAALLKEAVAVLATTKPGAKLVGERFATGKLPKDFFAQVSAALKPFDTDPAIAKLSAAMMKGNLKLTLQPAQVEKVRQLVLTKGDPKKGKELYLNTALLACATCHTMEGVGGSVGPDLTRVWDTMTVEKMLESIVDPGKEIKEGFQMFRAVTTGGQVINGLRITESAKDFLLRDATGRDIRVMKDELESISPSKLSLMPEDALAQLSYDQLIDLLAFLKSKPEQESLRGAVLDFAVAGPFPNDAGWAPAAGTTDTGAKGVLWKAAGAGANGLVELKPHMPAKPGAVYVRAFVYSPKPQTVKGVLLADDPLRVWVNDDVAYDRDTPKIVPLGSEETFRAELKTGWNTLLVKAANGGATHRLGLRLVGDGIRSAARVQTAAGGQ